MSNNRSDPIHSPVGILGFNALWEKDSYKDESTGVESLPRYKADLVLDPGDTGDLWDVIYQLATEATGKSEEDIEAAITHGGFSVPLKDGDDIASKREARGKNADLVKGKEVLRAATSFNSSGDNAPGGIYVVDEHNKKIEWDRRDKLHLGCLMRFSVTFGYYKNGTNEGVTAYLNGAQYVAEGERLGPAKDGMFSPMAKGEEGKRRSRRGK